MYTIKAELLDVKPKIWRKFQIQSNASPEDLSRAVLVMFNANISHFYELKKPDGTILFSNDEENGESECSSLNELFSDEKDWLILRYDYGDNWEIKLVLEKVNQKTGPCKLISGKGFGFFDDMGGPDSLSGLLYVHPKLADKLSPEQIDRIVRRINSDDHASFSSKGCKAGQKLLDEEEFSSFEDKHYIDWSSLKTCLVAKVSLKGAHPAIWREICFCKDLTLDEFITRLLFSFNADLSHLFQLSDRYGTVILQSEDTWNESAEDGDTPVELGLTRYGWPLSLWYDFGYDWKFIIKFKGVVLSSYRWKILKSKGEGIIEDCGGVWALNQIYAGNPEFRDYLEDDD